MKTGRLQEISLGSLQDRYQAVKDKMLFTQFKVDETPPTRVVMQVREDLRSAMQTVNNIQPPGRKYTKFESNKGQILIVCCENKLSILTFLWI